MSAPAGLAPTISEELKQVLGERLSASRYDIESHGVDESYHPAAPPDAVARHRQLIRHWFFHLIYPRVFEKALTPEEARDVFARSPFGAPVRERMLLDGCFWLFEARKSESG